MNLSEQSLARKKIRKIRRAVVGLVLGCLIFSSSGYGYVLQGPHIVDLMARNFTHNKNFKSVHKRVVFEFGQPPETTMLEETLWCSFPGRFRSETTSATVRRLQLVSNGRRLTVLDGKLIPQAESGGDLYPEMLCYKPRRLWVDRLSDLGVDVRLASLGRFDGTVAYVIGARYPELQSIQIWIDKESFLPIRWIIPSALGDTDSRMEIRYRDWGLVNGVRYPRLIEFYSGDRQVCILETQTVEPKPILEDGFFDPYRFKALYETPVSENGFDPAEADMGEVRKTIEDFRRIFE